MAWIDFHNALFGQAEEAIVHEDGTQEHPEAPGRRDGRKQGVKP